MDAVVDAEDVRRTYGDVVAVDGVSLAVEAGEVYALVGPNGAGKTTLVRALVGTTDHEGTVNVFGGPPRAADPGRMGLLPQSFEPAERLTARELVAYYARLYDRSRPVDAVLADVGMAEDDDVRYGRLSGGQRRRTCVATALVNDPDLLVLDEPTTGIDPGGRRSLWRLLEGLAEGGTTVLLTTHYMEEAERLADRVGLLAGGRLVTEGPPDDLVAEHGGTARLEIRLAGVEDSGDAGGPGERARAALLEAGLAPVEVDGAPAASAVVHDADPRAIGRALDTLDAAEVGYEAVTWRQPDLESVYLSLTGTGVGSAGEAVGRRDAGTGTGTDAGSGSGTEPGYEHEHEYEYEGGSGMPATEGEP